VGVGRVGRVGQTARTGVRGVRGRGAWADRGDEREGLGCLDRDADALPEAVEDSEHLPLKTRNKTRKICCGLP
jgi:hypothetical protein